MANRQMPILAPRNTTLKIWASLKMPKLWDLEKRDGKTCKEAVDITILGSPSRDGGFETLIGPPGRETESPSTLTLHSLGQAHKLPQPPVSV